MPNIAKKSVSKNPTFSYISNNGVEEDDTMEDCIIDTSKENILCKKIVKRMEDDDVIILEPYPEINPAQNLKRTGCQNGHEDRKRIRLDTTTSTPPSNTLSKDASYNILPLKNSLLTTSAIMPKNSQSNAQENTLMISKEKLEQMVFSKIKERMPLIKKDLLQNVPKMLAANMKENKHLRDTFTAVVEQVQLLNKKLQETEAENVKLKKQLKELQSSPPFHLPPLLTPELSQYKDPSSSYQQAHQPRETDNSPIKPGAFLNPPILYKSSPPHSLNPLKNTSKYFSFQQISKKSINTLNNTNSKTPNNNTINKSNKTPNNNISNKSTPNIKNNTPRKNNTPNNNIINIDNNPPYKPIPKNIIPSNNNNNTMQSNNNNTIQSNNNSTIQSNNNNTGNTTSSQHLSNGTSSGNKAPIMPTIELLIDLTIDNNTTTNNTTTTNNNNNITTATTNTKINTTSSTTTTNTTANVAVTTNTTATPSKLATPSASSETLPILPSREYESLTLGRPCLRFQLSEQNLRLQWSMQGGQSEDIKSYQIFALPSSCREWIEVGKVGAMLLPMVCGLEVPTTANTAYVIRGIDAASSTSPYSNVVSVDLDTITTREL